MCVQVVVLSDGLSTRFTTEVKSEGGRHILRNGWLNRDSLDGRVLEWSRNPTESRGPGRRVKREGQKQEGTQKPRPERRGPRTTTEEGPDQDLCVRVR